MEGVSVNFCLLSLTRTHSIFTAGRIIWTGTICTVPMIPDDHVASCSQPLERLETQMSARIKQEMVCIVSMVSIYDNQDGDYCNSQLTVFELYSEFRKITRWLRAFNPCTLVFPNNNSKLAHMISITFDSNSFPDVSVRVSYIGLITQTGLT